MISDESATKIYSEIQPEGEVSDREVSPKLIVGTKKYGRRSRPHQILGLDVTDSDNTDEDQHKSLNGCNDHTVQVRWLTKNIANFSLLINSFPFRCSGHPHKAIFLAVESCAPSTTAAASSSVAPRYRHAKICTPKWWPRQQQRAPQRPRQ